MRDWIVSGVLDRFSRCRLHFVTWPKLGQSHGLHLSMLSGRRVPSRSNQSASSIGCEKTMLQSVVWNPFVFVCRTPRRLVEVVVEQKKKALTFALSSLLFTATVLEGLFGEYHSSSAALGQQRPEVTKQPLVHDWSATSKALCDVNRRFARNTEGKFVQGVKQWQWKTWLDYPCVFCPFSFVLFVSARWNCLFLPPIAPYVGLDGTAQRVNLCWATASLCSVSGGGFFLVISAWF